MLGTNLPDNGRGEQVTFKLDGVVKAPSGTITGNSLHALAGFPAQLIEVGGKAVPKNDDPYPVGPKTEFITKNSLGHTELNPEHTLAASAAVVDPPHGQVISHVSEEEAAAIKKKQDDEKKAADAKAGDAKPADPKSATPLVNSPPAGTPAR